MTDDIDWTALSVKQYAAFYTDAERRRNPARWGSPLRRARAEAHQAFDRIWKEGHLTRTDAYRWLALEMGLPVGDCHMGMMTSKECERVAAASRAYLKAARKARGAARAVAHNTRKMR